jgi:hypothetical protein
MYEKETLDNAILYLLKDHPEIEPREMVALLYIADVYHLLLYGRTITNSIKDTKYWLMDTEDMKELIEGLKGSGGDFEYLSETDMDALEFAYNRRQLDFDGFKSIPMCFGIKES